jgi:hypothetical protein
MPWVGAAWVVIAGLYVDFIITINNWPAAVWPITGNNDVVTDPARIGIDTKRGKVFSFMIYVHPIRIVNIKIYLANDPARIRI